MKVIYKATGEVITDNCTTLAEAQAVVAVCVKMANEIKAGKRENKNDYIITE